MRLGLTLILPPPSRLQVEFSYPPLLPDEGHDSGGLPEQWRYLPFLALPDGAHNYQEGQPRPNMGALAFTAPTTRWESNP